MKKPGEPGYAYTTERLWHIWIVVSILYVAAMFGVAIYGAIMAS